MTLLYLACNHGMGNGWDSSVPVARCGCIVAWPLKKDVAWTRKGAGCFFRKLLDVLLMLQFAWN